MPKNKNKNKSFSLSTQIFNDIRNVPEHLQPLLCDSLSDLFAQYAKSMREDNLSMDLSTNKTFNWVNDGVDTITTTNGDKL